MLAIGALTAAKEFGYVLRQLGQPIPRSSQAHRFNLMDKLWRESLNNVDVLSRAANDDLVRALELHVLHYEDFYAALGSSVCASVKSCRSDP